MKPISLHAPFKVVSLCGSTIPSLTRRPFTCTGMCSDIFQTDLIFRFRNFNINVRLEFYRCGFHCGEMSVLMELLI